MKNKKKIIIILVILAVVGIFIALTYGRNTAIKLSLKDFCQESEFQYGQTNWGDSLEEVKQTFPTALEIDTYLTSGESEIYNAKKTFLLDGQKAKVSLEFLNDQLQGVRFSFKVSDNCEEWFEKQIEQLQDLIGMEDKQYDNSAEPYLPSVGYRWDAENTTLQVAWIKGPGDTSVIFSLGLK